MAGDQILRKVLARQYLMVKRTMKRMTILETDSMLVSMALRVFKELLFKLENLTEMSCQWGRGTGCLQTLGIRCRRLLVNGTRCNRQHCQQIPRRTWSSWRAKPCGNRLTARRIAKRWNRHSTPVCAGRWTSRTSQVPTRTKPCKHLFRE